MQEIRGWSRKELFVCVVFACATFAASFVLGSGITLALGPGTSGVATILITTVIVVIGANIVGTIGYFTLVVTLFTVLAIPTNMFGPPGPHKVIIGLSTGLVYDLAWNLTARKRFSLPFAAAVSTAASILLIFLFMVWFFPEHPKRETIAGLLKYLIPVYAVLGFIGGVLGDWIYKKSLADLSIVKMLKQ
ncbi:MAG: hypothetical protein Q8Q12_10640 [bacterium]|nr:hypothetical protein [bacterium]